MRPTTATITTTTTTTPRTDLPEMVGTSHRGERIGVKEGRNGTWSVVTFEVGAHGDYRTYVVESVESSRQRAVEVAQRYLGQ